LDTTVRMNNEVVLDHMLSDDPGMQKVAADNLNAYIRRKERENGIMRSIIDPVTVTPADLDPQVNNEEPAIIFEREPDTTVAVTVPFGSGVDSTEIEGDRFLVTFNTIRSLKKRKSKFQLMTYRNDIRQIITDLDVNELLEHEDRRFFATIDSMLGGAANTSLTAAGSVAMWQTVAGGLTLQSLIDCLQIMPKGSGRFVPATIVMNMVRAMDLLGWDADDLGPNVREEVGQRGWTQTEILGKRLIITIKRDIVGDNDVYMFAESDKLGKLCVLQEATIYPEVKVDMVEWCVMECLGMTLAQVTGVAKATLTA